MLFIYDKYIHIHIIFICDNYMYSYKTKLEIVFVFSDLENHMHTNNVKFVTMLFLLKLI